MKEKDLRRRFIKMTGAGRPAAAGLSFYAMGRAIRVRSVCSYGGAYQHLRKAFDPFGEGDRIKVTTPSPQLSNVKAQVTPHTRT
jgi:hypothetical protein